MADDIWIWLDGTVLPAAEARVPVLDRGFLYGDSVFEVTRTVGKEPLLLTEHLERLERSAAALAFGTPPREAIASAVAATLAAVPTDECYVRIMVTRGAGPIDLDPASADAPRLVVIAKPLHLPDERQRREGVAMVTVDERRNAPGHVPAAVKSSNYLSSVMALRSARQRGAHEALMCDLAGNVSEGASSNFFLVRDGRILTPPLALGILAGVTRSVVFSLATELGLKVEEVAFPKSAALSADEAFLTSSIRGLLPVTRLDGQAIGSGQPGPITQRLMAGYQARYLASYLERSSSASPMRKSSSASPR